MVRPGGRFRKAAQKLFKANLLWDWKAGENTNKMIFGAEGSRDFNRALVYRISNWVNRGKEIIPRDSITKVPSAELRPNQTDQDSLPPYDVLDAILEEYVVRCRSAAEMIKLGYDETTVRRVVRLIDFNEYKRRQAAPGLKVTSKAFGVGRRIPIAQRSAPE